MIIRKANQADLAEISGIYDRAREFMAAAGNPTQWENGYPPRSMLEDDIKNKRLFVCEQDGKLCGVFAFIIGDDPTYGYIEDGAWLNAERYGTIHRIASNGEVKGLAGACISYCRALISNLRADTHADNIPMQRVLEKNGFVRCGTIYVEDGTPRIAYQTK